MTADNTPTTVLVIKCLADGTAEFEETNLLDAKGLIQGFLMGGTPMQTINGGYRFLAPTAAYDYIDVVDARVLTDEWKHQ